LLALCDGERVVALPPARDHKRLADGDLGPNTGGMGAVAPCGLDADQVEAVLDAVHRPVVRWMAAQGAPFRGVLYAGLMLTADGPKVLEFNVRFGDPECQVLCALWADDPLPWLLGAAQGRLPAGAPRFRPGAACVVVLAAPGYPACASLGQPIPLGRETPRSWAIFAGATRWLDGSARVSGGRALGVVGLGDTAPEARAAAYDILPSWAFEGAQWRTDIGATAT
jgi:phosphoribosylamine--glycine ligase